MAKHEIKLRKQLIDSDTLQRHRNYSALLKLHERAKRVRKTKRFFIYTLVIAVVTVLLLIVFSYWVLKLEKEREPKHGIKKVSWLRKK